MEIISDSALKKKLYSLQSSAVHAENQAVNYKLLTQRSEAPKIQTA